MRNFVDILHIIPITKDEAIRCMESESEFNILTKKKLKYEFQNSKWKNNFGVPINHDLKCHVIRQQMKDCQNYFIVCKVTEDEKIITLH